MFGDLHYRRNGTAKTPINKQQKSAINLYPQIGGQPNTVIMRGHQMEKVRFLIFFHE